MNDVTVIKLNPKGQETWRYSGRLLQHGSGQIVLEAFFDRADMDLHGLYLGRGDRFQETYFTTRWYNIFEIHAREDDHLRGWYCNICCPAQIEAGRLSYVDLALDLLVFPDGRQVVLDEDEFAALQIPDEMRLQARAALEALQADFTRRLAGDEALRQG